MVNFQPDCPAGFTGLRSKIKEPSDTLNLGIINCKGTNKCWGKKNNHNPFCLGINIELQESSLNTLFLETMNEVFSFLKSKLSEYYWTHYLKCPGNFKKSANNDYDINVCADMWLEKEIAEFKPNMMFTFGQYPGTYLCGKPIDKFSKFYERNDLKYKVDPGIPLFMFPHPSGANPQFNEWREDNYKKLKERIGEIWDL